MQITAAQLKPGTIVLSQSIPSLSVGRTVVATVLSMPKDGSVLVSMFGQRVLVDTTIPLEKGQVLNLKVHAVSPKVVLKPVQLEADQQAAAPLKDLGSLLGTIVGKPGEKELSSFLLKEIATQLSTSGQDAASAQLVKSFVDQVYTYPNAIAHLLIPIVDNESRGAARVSIEREGGAYVLNFDMETDQLGSLACTVRMEEGRGMDVEIRTPSDETAAFLRTGLLELKEGLEPFGVRSIEVVRGRVKALAAREVNVLV